MSGVADYRPNVHPNTLFVADNVLRTERIPRRRKARAIRAREIQKPAVDRAGAAAPAKEAPERESQGRRVQLRHHTAGDPIQIHALLQPGLGTQRWI